MAIDRDTAERLAARLREAEEKRAPISPLREQLPDVDSAYAVQQANTKHWLAKGRRLVGRKIGLTAKAVQQQLGVDQPDYGMLYADMALGDGDEVSMKRLMQPKLEAEVAFVLGRDLNGEDLTLPELMSAIEYAVAAIEIVGSRIEKWDIKIADTIADNASSGMFVLGAQPRKLDGLDLRLAGMVLERRGEILSLGTGAACLGNPLNASLWLARTMARVKAPLKAGDVIMSGALGPMAPVSAGDVVEAKIGGLGSVKAVFTE